VDLQHGQKTGFFLDQRENRILAGSMHPARHWIAYEHGSVLRFSLPGAASPFLEWTYPRILFALARRNCALNGFGNV